MIDFFSNIVDTRFLVSSLSASSLLSHAIVSKSLDLIKRFYLLVSSLQLDQGKLIGDLFCFWNLSSRLIAIILVRPLSRPGHSLLTIHLFVYLLQIVVSSGSDLPPVPLLWFHSFYSQPSHLRLTSLLTVHLILQLHNNLLQNYALKMCLFRFSPI
jgi:hypothetical protein